MLKDFCPKLGVCGGCAWGMRELEIQLFDKRAEVLELFSNPQFAELPALGLRDRADLVWHNGLLGLYGLMDREVVDLPGCPMMSAPLERLFVEFRKLAPPIAGRGSVRLRISPGGDRGVWLDFSNQDVKSLFEERKYLRWLSDLAFVEIGQRRKSLVWKDGAPKLVDPVLKPWFETYDPQGGAIPLFGPVGGFSQAGFAANRVLVRLVGEAAEASGLSTWVELFSGNGNFALALAARGLQVQALEVENLAVQGLEMSAALHPEWRLDIQRADAYLQTQSLPRLSGRGLLVDPPRAGLRQVLNWLENGERPEALIYVSCFADVLKSDVARLRGMGYVLKSLVGVDQFAHSPHCEWVACLELNSSNLN